MIGGSLTQYGNRWGGGKDMEVETLDKVSRRCRIGGTGGRNDYKVSGGVW